MQNREGRYDGKTMYLIIKAIKASNCVMAEFIRPGRRRTLARSKELGQCKPCEREIDQKIEKAVIQTNNRKLTVVNECLTPKSTQT